MSIDLNFCSLVYGNLTLSPLPTKKILALCELELYFELFRLLSGEMVNKQEKLHQYRKTSHICFLHDSVTYSNPLYHYEGKRSPTSQRSYNIFFVQLWNSTNMDRHGGVPHVIFMFGLTNSSY